MDQWVIAVATFSLAIVALFQNRFWAWMKRPKLVVDTGAHAPFAKKLLFETKDASGVFSDAYGLRISVINTGGVWRMPARAPLVEVFLLRVSKKQTDGSFQPIPEFEPMNLIWSHSFLPVTDISHEMLRYCFIGRILKPSERGQFPLFDDERIPGDQTCLALDVSMRRNTKEHVLAPGTYKLECLIGSANTEAFKKTIEVHLSGDWHDDQEKMFERGFRVELVDDNPD